MFPPISRKPTATKRKEQLASHNVQFVLTESGPKKPFSYHNSVIHTIYTTNLRKRNGHSSPSNIVWEAMTGWPLERSTLFVTQTRPRAGPGGLELQRADKETIKLSQNINTHPLQLLKEIAAHKKHLISCAAHLSVNISKFYQLKGTPGY